MTCVHWRSELAKKDCTPRMKQFLNQDKQFLLFWDRRNSSHHAWNSHVTKASRAYEELASEHWRVLPDATLDDTLSLALKDLAATRLCKELFVTPPDCKITNGFESMLAQYANVAKVSHWR